MSYEYHRLSGGEPYRFNSIGRTKLNILGNKVIDSVIKLNKINNEIRLGEIEQQLNYLKKKNNRTRKQQFRL